MKYLKKFNESLSDIEEFCKKHIESDNRERIEKGEHIYEIDGNKIKLFNYLSIDLKNYDTIPYKIIGEPDTLFVSGDITSLENLSLTRVNHTLNLMSCGKLTTLEGAPEYVGIWLHCGSIPLNSLVGIPKPIVNEERNRRGYKLTFTKWGRSLAHILKFFIEPTADEKTEFIINYDAHELIELFNEYDPIRENDTIILDRLNEFLIAIDKPTITEKDIEYYKCI